MPNHFHMTVCEHKESGIAQYMQRVLCAYTKYFNAKYNKNGHLFQGPYKAVHIEDNNQILYLSTYIHRNPCELKNWRNKEYNYPWSSYQDYCSYNRWGALLKTNIITNQFSQKEYKQFVLSSIAKRSNQELENDSLFIDMN